MRARAIDPEKLIYHVEIWSSDGKPYQLFGAAIDTEVAKAMARAALDARPDQKVRLIGKPQHYGFKIVDPYALSFHIETWRRKPLGMEALIGCASHLLVARAGFSAAVAAEPRKIVTLRHGAHVIASSEQGDR